MNIANKVVEAYAAQLRRADQKAALASMNRSIHPRNWSAGGKKQNTCGSPSAAVKARKVAAIEHHLERHPRDDASRAHLAKIQARA